MYYYIVLSGSPPFDYCVYYMFGQYNITGNEVCNKTIRTISNNFPLVHYFSEGDQHTVVVVIENELGKTVSRATINIYKGKWSEDIVSKQLIQ